MDNKYKSILVVISVVSFLLSPNFAFTKSLRFQREYTYQASEADSKLSCRAIALEQVKRLLLEELGTYLEAETAVKNYQLTKDQVTTLTAGIVQTEIVDEKWDGKRYWLKAKIVADPEKVAKSLEDMRKDAEEASKEIERLKRELALVKGKTDVRKLSQYNKAVNKLSAIDWAKKGHAFSISNNHEEAVKANTEALELNPDFAAVYVNRGVAYFYKGQYVKAVADFSEAIKLNPNDANAYNNRGGGLQRPRSV